MHGADVDAKRVGDLLRGQVVVVTQYDRQAVLLVQAVDGAPDGFGVLRLHHAPLRALLGFRFLHGRIHQIVLEVAAPLALPKLRPAGVDGDGEEPGVEGGFAAVAGQRLEGGDEALLYGILSVVGVVQDGDTQAKDARLVLGHQGFDGLRVAGATAA